jgi:peroxiredoxin
MSRQKTVVLQIAAALAFILTLASLQFAASPQIKLTADEATIKSKMSSLRALPDSARAQSTKDLAFAIRKLPAGPNKVSLASGLVGLSTEGDLGHDTIQESATTLASALAEAPVPTGKDGPALPYTQLAQLVRIEHVEVTLGDPQFATALKNFDQRSEKIAAANFTLSDLKGKSWSLAELHGKVVLVNFWATWCEPCRSEMPDLDDLNKKFKKKGLVVLAISNESGTVVRPFIGKSQLSYTVLLDPGGKVADEFGIVGIPETFVYNRDGKLVAQSVDTRTEKQFIAMLAQAGVE